MNQTRILIGTVMQVYATMNRLKVTIDQSGRASTCVYEPGATYNVGDKVLVAKDWDLDQMFVLAYMGRSNATGQAVGSPHSADRINKKLPAAPSNVRAYTTPDLAVLCWRPIFEDYNCWYVVQRATDASGTGGQTYLITQGSFFVGVDSTYTHYRVAAAILIAGGLSVGPWSDWAEASFGSGTNSVTFTNRSGAALAQGDVVVIDADNDESVETTTEESVSDNVVGVATEAIANGVAGDIAIMGYVSRVNTDTVSTPSIPGTPSVGYWLSTSCRAGNADVSDTLSEGVFGMCASGGQNPSAILFGLPVQALGGGSGGAPTDAPYMTLGTDGDLSAEIDMQEQYPVNLVKNSPGEIVSASGTPQWWDVISSATASDSTSASERFGQCFDVASNASGDGIEQTLTFADEALLYAGVTVSFSCWVKADSVGKASIAINSANVSESESSANTGTGWELLKVEAFTTDGADTSFDIKMMVDGSGGETGADFACPMLVVGSKCMPWVPRGIDYHALDDTSLFNTEGTGDVSWSDLDCNSETHNLAVGIAVNANIYADAADVGNPTSVLYIGHHDDVVGGDNYSMVLRAQVADIGNDQIWNFVRCNDSQQIRYYISEKSSNGDLMVMIDAVGYWHWKHAVITMGGGAG